MNAEGRRPAVLLLGPTGAGKTPLGELMEKRGLWGTRCLHFDFGANLRRIVARNRPDRWIGREELDFLKGVLQSGALLENEHFSIAERVLHSFLAEREADAQTLIVLNGLPRHVGQADAVDRFLEVRMVVALRCSPDTVLARLRSNIGGDRTGREDDDLPSVWSKLALFDSRTALLLDHYRARGTRIETVEVTAGMTAEGMLESGQSFSISKKSC